MELTFLSHRASQQESRDFNPGNWTIDHVSNHITGQSSDTAFLLDPSLSLLLIPSEIKKGSEFFVTSGFHMINS